MSDFLRFLNALEPDTGMPLVFRFGSADKAMHAWGFGDTTTREWAERVNAEGQNVWADQLLRVWAAAAYPVKRAKVKP